MTIISIPEFAPDQPDLPSVTSDTVFNVVPSTVNSYSPVKSLKPHAKAIDDRCQGGLQITNTDGISRVFCGDASKLYRLTSLSSTPSDVSKSGGYTTSSEINWSFAQFGDMVIATNYNDAPQVYTDGTSMLFSNLITSGVTSLKAKYVAAVRNFIVFGNCSDATYGNRPQSVWWSAVEDPTTFPTVGTSAAINALSDRQDNVGDHGECTGLVGNLGSIDCAVFYRNAIYRMVWAGLPDIFDFQKVTGNRGNICPYGLAQLDNVAYFISEDGVMSFDGANIVPIGKNRIDRYIMADLDKTYLSRVSCCVEPKYGLIVWAYPSNGASNGVPNRLLFYSPSLDRFTITRTDDVNVEFLLRGATFNKTLENLDSIATLDGLAYSLDSGVWLGTNTFLSGFDSSHRFGYFGGDNLEAEIVTSDFEPIQGRQSVITRVRPMSDTDSCVVSGCGRDKISVVPSYGTPSSMENNGSIGLRQRGRYHRLKSIIPAGAEWDKFSGIDVEDVKDGGLR